MEIVDEVREAAWIYNINSLMNADKRGGGPKTQIFYRRPTIIAP